MHKKLVLLQLSGDIIFIKKTGFHTNKKYQNNRYYFFIHYILVQHVVNNKYNILFVIKPG